VPRCRPARRWGRVADVQAHRALLAGGHRAGHRAGRRVRDRRHPPVAVVKDPADQAGRLVGGGRDDVRPVDADGRRADEPLGRRLFLGGDLAHDDGARIAARLGQGRAQIRQRPRVRGAAGPEEQLDASVAHSVPRLPSKGHAARTDTFDLGGLGLSSGEGRRLDLGVRLGTFDFGGERYQTEPALVPVRLDVSRMTAVGTRCARASRRRSAARACAASVTPRRSSPSTPARSTSPGVATSSRALTSRARCSTWPRGRATRSRWRCRRRWSAAKTAPACAGMRPEPQRGRAGHTHERAPDPRWAKLRELRLE
jgi:uncharacterized protein